jgi:LytS/YehU family sensor histidine kinase
MYIVVPRFLLKGRYLQTVLLVLLLFLVTAVLSALIGIYAVRPLRAAVLPQIYVTQPHNTLINFYLALLAGLRGAITIGGLATTIKLMKHWYVKEQQNLQLQKENIEAQLEVLKSQVHPHFLFNTMNNIFSHTQEKAPEAAQMILSLSDMLRYILYECNRDLVPLKKELKLIQSYMALEKARYERLDLQIQVPEETEGLLIAPLMLLPFIENCFKHGTSQDLEQPWIHINISVSGNVMSMKLVNSKPNITEQKKDHTGIGIENVRKRLSLIYPNKHQLQIFDEAEMFIVSLKLELSKVSETVVTPVLLTTKKMNYV